MIKNIIIFVLTITTIIFATLFIIYYNNIDSYMKEKEVDIINRETIVSQKENTIKQYDTCIHNLNNLQSAVNRIKNIVNTTSEYTSE
jgi:hypothetical protein